MADVKNGQPMTPEEIATQAGLVAAPQVAAQEPGAMLSPPADKTMKNVPSAKAVGLLVLARFDRVAAQRANHPMVIGQVIECGVMMSDGSLTSPFPPADFFAEILPDNHVNIVSSAGHNLTGTMYEKINLNGVEFTDTIAIEMTVRQAIATRGELVRVLRHQPPAPVLASGAPVEQSFPNIPTVPLQGEEEKIPIYPHVLSADGRPIEDPRTYAYRDSFPPTLGWQVEWELVLEAEGVQWYSGAIRRANRALVIAYACLLSDADTPNTEDVLKIQLYSQKDAVIIPPSRINGVKLLFEFDIENASQAITGLSERWWTAVLDKSEDIDTVIGFDHEDEIDRMNRVQVGGITSGKSSRDATILSLRDREAFKHSIR